MSGRIGRARVGWVGIACAAALSACAPDDAPFTTAAGANPPAALTPVAPAERGARLIQAFIGRADLVQGTLTIEPAPGDGDRVAQALTNIPAGTTLGGPNTVTMSSTNLQNNCTVNGQFYSGSRCGDIRVTSQYAGTLRNVYFQIDTITPTSAAARNSDPAVLTLNNTLGLWAFGAVPGNSTSAPRTWVFDIRSGITAFSFRGTVWADPPCATDGNLSDCGSTGACQDLSTDPLNCGFCGVACGASRACVAGACSCPTGQTSCSGGCVSTNNDPNNCGGCGIVCRGTGAVCTNGVCSCSNSAHTFFCMSNTGVGGTCVADCGSCNTGTNACNATNQCLSACATCAGGANRRCPPAVLGQAGTCISNCSMCSGDRTTCSIGGALSCTASCPSCTAMGGTCL